MPRHRAVCHFIQPKTRLLVAVILAFGAAMVRDLTLLPALAALVLCVIFLAQPPTGFARRLRAPFLLAVGIMALLPPFGTGPTLFQIGPFFYPVETTQAALLIAARLLAIVTMVLALLSGLSDFQLVTALRGLRVPALICDLALLTLRYQHDLRAELARARLARRLRGGANGWRALTDFGALLAVLLIRALQRSERVWAAMRVRGYHRTMTHPPALLAVPDYAATGLALIISAALIWTGL